MTSGTGGFVLGVDGGGTATRCVVAGLEGTVVGVGEGGPSNHRRVGIDAAVEHVRQAAQAALDEAGLEPPLAAACFCLAGAGLPDARAKVLANLESLGLARSVALFSDARGAWAGAHALQPGIVLIAGTGAVAFGVAEDGREVLTDGWGPLWGDEGGAYWIGLRTLKAVARAHDGRGPCTSLTGALLAHLQVDDPREIIARLPLDRTHSREIAALAAVCDTQAEQGDEPARRILRLAGAQLAQTAAAAAAALALEPAPHIALMGGVLRSRTVRGSLGESLMGNLPRAVTGKPLLPAAMGACLLAMKSVGAATGDNVCAALRHSLGRSRTGSALDW